MHLGVYFIRKAREEVNKLNVAKSQTTGEQLCPKMVFSRAEETRSFKPVWCVWIGHVVFLYSSTASLKASLHTRVKKKRPSCRKEYG